MLCTFAHISSSTSLAWTRRSTPRLIAQSLLRVDEIHASHHCSAMRSSTTTTRLPPRDSSHHKLQRRHFQSSSCTNGIYPCNLSLLKSLWTTTNLTNPTKATETTTIRCSGTKSNNSGDGQSTDESKKAKVKKPRKVTTLSVMAKKRRGQKITMVTAYDYPSAVHVDRAGIDIVLVGDSCAMVELGFENTQPITLDQMIHHCQAVKRGAPNRPLLVGDMPFGSYEFKDVDIALKNAYRMVKEGGMDAVKFEVCLE